MVSRLWRRFRNHEEIEFLNGRIESLSEDSAQLWRARDDAREETEKVRAELLAALDRERTSRISAESIAVERLKRSDLLEAEVKWLRDEINAVIRERLKSLDLINQRLIESQVRTEPPPPDMKQFQRESLRQVGNQIVKNVHELNQSIDRAIFAKHYPQMFARPAAPAQPSGVVTNEPTTDPNPAA